MASILVVDDDSSIRTLVRDVLELAGHQVIEAANGALALLEIRDVSPDLIVTDVRMPVMDGAALIKHLRVDPVLSLTPILVLTGEPAPPPEASAALQKPFEPHALLAAADSLLSAAPVR